MFTVSATFDQTMLYFVAVNLLAILAYALLQRRRGRRGTRETATVTAAVRQFFRETGGNVTVECIARDRAGGHTVLIDTGSSKRFRYSHIVEMILADYVRESCGLTLQRVYWRFPISEGRDAPLPAVKARQAEEIARDVDAYLGEGLRRLKEIPDYEVTESSLETYQAYIDRSGRGGNPPVQAPAAPAAPRAKAVA